jgi:hypothetical protein
MSIEYLDCGCSITRSMFGDQEIVGMTICFKHCHEHQSTLQLLAGLINTPFLPEIRDETTDDKIQPNN